MSTSESVFRNRSFRLFFAGQAFGYVGDGLRLIAIPLLVYHLTGSALSTGITYALELGPFALFGLVGGSLADRLDRRTVMIVCDVVRFAVLAAFAIGYARGVTESRSAVRGHRRALDRGGDLRGRSARRRFPI